MERNTFDTITTVKRRSSHRLMKFVLRPEQGLQLNLALQFFLNNKEYNE